MLHRRAFVIGSLLFCSPLSASAEPADTAQAPPSSAAEGAPAAAVTDAVTGDVAEPEGADAPSAEGEELSPEAQIAAFHASLSFQQNDVKVGDELAVLKLGDSFRYLNAEDAERVLVAWGNPPGSESLGMLVPAKLGPMDDEGWGVIITYSEEGHVEDDDAADMDFDGLLEEMQEGTESDNESRKEAGFGELHLVGWAEPPHYDSQTKKLYWAKELDFGEGEHTLNYSVRILGRKGVLELNAVAGVAQLAPIRTAMTDVLGRVDFQEGQRYADFDPEIDEVAAYGIGALIAGKLALKAGLFKGLLVLLLASKKFLVVGGIAVLAALRKFWPWGSKEDPDNQESEA